MRKLKYTILSLFAMSSMLFSCIDDDNDELTGEAIQGGLVELNNAAIGYVVGDNGTYTASGSVYQGNIQTTSIDVYKSFSSSASGSTSNEVLMTTLTINNTNVSETGTFEFSFTYENLIQGLTIDNNPFPTDDGTLNIGDFWELRYVSTTSDGNVNSNSVTTKVSVGTRFAGTYNVINHQYWRIGVLRDDVEWPATMLIESVDAITYRVVEYFGAFSGNEYYFQIDENDRITYPENTPSGEQQTGNGQPMTTCELNASDLTNVPCGAATNYVERDDVNGEDKLYMTFGYFTSGSGPREFYQVLEKIVE